MTDVAQVDQRDVRITQLERELDDARSDASRLATELIAELASATTRLFGGAVEIKEGFDPEFRNDRYVVLSVDTQLSAEQIVQAEQAWIRELAKIAPGWDSLRLRIRPH